MDINESNYVDVAEKVISELKDTKDKNGRSVPMLTTSKIRNILSMAADIYNVVLSESSDKLSVDLCGRIDYLRVRLLYEAGRDAKVKLFVDKADLIIVLKKINGSKSRYIQFYRYLEALVAFHKYYGGKD